MRLEVIVCESETNLVTEPSILDQRYHNQPINNVCMHEETRYRPRFMGMISTSDTIKAVAKINNALYCLLKCVISCIFQYIYTYNMKATNHAIDLVFHSYNVYVLSAMPTPNSM
jgi:hypothetical protein